MQRLFRRSVPGWYGLVGAVSALIAATTLSGCPGTLDPEIVKMLGSGGSTGTGGSTGSGGSSNCTGNNDINYIIAGSSNSFACAQSNCHVPGALSADISGGLDLTLDANVGSRLIDMNVGTSGNDSMCVGKGNYLDAKSNPPTGLLMTKISSSPPCGDRMPWPGGQVAPALTSQQIACVSAWAEGLIMAAP